jgi:hypothetical protein
MKSYTQDFEERRKAENRLKRISVENDLEQEARVQKWLEIADKILEKDRENTPTSQAA